MHGKDIKNLPEHQPDALNFGGLKYFFSSQDVPMGQTLLVHDLQSLFNIVEAGFFGATSWVEP